MKSSTAASAEKVKFGEDWRMYHSHTCGKYGEGNGEEGFAMVKVEYDNRKSASLEAMLVVHVPRSDAVGYVAHLKSLFF